MSDIGLPNMEWLLDLFYAICVFGPPLILAPLFLLIGRFMSGYRGLFLGLYFVISIATVIGVLWWWSVWFNDPPMFYWSPLCGLVGTAFVYGFFFVLRQIFTRTRKTKMIAK